MGQISHEQSQERMLCTALFQRAWAVVLICDALVCEAGIPVFARGRLLLSTTNSQVIQYLPYCLDACFYCTVVCWLRDTRMAVLEQIAG